MTNPILFSIETYLSLSSDIARRLGCELGQIESRAFADGEGYLRLMNSVRERDVILVGGTYSDRALLDVFDLGCAISAYGARSLKILIPYFGHSTMERAVQSGEVVKAKTRARILSAIPIAPFGNQILFLDLHAEGIPFYFEGQVKTRHLYAKPVIMREARRIGGTSFVLGSVDAGRAKWVESLANDLNVQAGFVYKRRNSSGKVSIAGVNVSVEGRQVVIYDDMIRSGGSLLQAAQAYRDAGAAAISVICTHGLFTQGALGRLEESGLIKEVVCTDSHPSATLQKSSLLTVVSIAEVFSLALADEVSLPSKAN